ncbi:MAG: hypothetical protein QOJ23_1947 [Actinomycetota bacterium]|jgi:hypothetical protein|nr:hypothetical protein [Actinomycetota bacterium]MDQ1498077.1 hypothetical protein [Actinomycetota bacterium]MDQ1566420.1 hypothetical protein [Actinomycetota bacterium]
MFVMSVALTIVGAVGATAAVVREAPRFARWYRHAHNV